MSTRGERAKARAALRAVRPGRRRAWGQRSKVTTRVCITATVARAEGRRAAHVPRGSQAIWPGRLYSIPIAQYTSGGLSYRGRPFTQGISQSPLSAIARAEAANRGGVSSTRPVSPSCHTNSSTPSPRLASHSQRAGPAPTAGTGAGVVDFTDDPMDEGPMDNDPCGNPIGPGSSSRTPPAATAPSERRRPHGNSGAPPSGGRTGVAPAAPAARPPADRPDHPPGPGHH